jgi:Mg2+ and Co2+ transporter CorA
MNRTELRIGNLVERNGKIHEVSSIHADDTIRLFNKDKIASIGCFWLKEVNPIPITEEWLLKFGFKKYVTRDIYPTLSKNMLNWNDGSLYVIAYGFINEIKNVHQLQNLYFALTGEELTIKNETL